MTTLPFQPHYALASAMPPPVFSDHHLTPPLLGLLPAAQAESSPAESRTMEGPRAFGFAEAGFRPAIFCTGPKALAASAPRTPTWPSSPLVTRGLCCSYARIRLIAI